SLIMSDKSAWAVQSASHKNSGCAVFSSNESDSSHFMRTTTFLIRISLCSEPVAWESGGVDTHPEAAPVAANMGINKNNFLNTHTSYGETKDWQSFCSNCGSTSAARLQFVFFTGNLGRVVS